MKSPFPPACAAKYEARELLGSGGYGSVFKAIQLSLGRPVAIKILNTETLSDEAQIQRLIAEAKVTASLEHPHIVVVLDCDVEDGVPWIAYEYLTGKTMRALLKAGPVPVGLAVTASIHAALALVAAHKRGSFTGISNRTISSKLSRVCSR